METRNAIVELLHAGYSDRHIARRVHVANRRVHEVRAELGLPEVQPGPKPSAPEDRFWRFAKHTDDGHLLWPLVDNTIREGREGPKQSVGRVAFRMRYQREPVGKVLPGCGHDGCIHPAHVEDRLMRDQFRTIFGKAA